MTPKAEPQSEEVTLLWRIGAISCCCLLVIVVMIIANPLAMSKLLGWLFKQLIFLVIIFVDFKLVDDVDMGNATLD